MKAENEKLIVKNDTFYKLGEIALEQNIKKANIYRNRKKISLKLLKKTLSKLWT